MQAVRLLVLSHQAEDLQQLRLREEREAAQLHLAEQALSASLKS